MQDMTSQRSYPKFRDGKTRLLRSWVREQKCLSQLKIEKTQNSEKPQENFLITRWEATMYMCSSSEPNFSPRFGHMLPISFTYFNSVDQMLPTVET